MPLYEYRCAKCGDVFEVIQKFADAPLTVHEGCGGSVERLISTSGFNFKGSGWYVTDYAKSGASSQKKRLGFEEGFGRRFVQAVGLEDQNRNEVR